MKLVREHINEKFTKDSDPIEDMGIGIFVPKKYFNYNIAAKHIYEYLPVILKTNKIPKDIIYPLGYEKAFNVKYYPKIHNFIDKYVNNELLFKEDVQAELFRILHTEGYPKK